MHHLSHSTLTSFFHEASGVFIYKGPSIFRTFILGVSFATFLYE